MSQCVPYTMAELKPHHQMYSFMCFNLLRVESPARQLCRILFAGFLIFTFNSGVPLGDGDEEN